MAAERRKRKKRRSPAGYIIVIFLLLTLVGLLVYEHFYPVRRLPAGTWVREEDLTAITDRAIGEWLRSAEYGDIETEERTSENVTVKTVLVIRSDGTYERYVDEASYAMAKETAYRNFAEALGSLINTRFKSVGMADENGVSDGEIEALMNEAVGMSVDEYLKKAVPGIMPDYEEYSQGISGSGSCRVEGGYIYFDEEDGQILLFDKTRMLIDDVVYMGAENDG